MKEKKSASAGRLIGLRAAETTTFVSTTSLNRGILGSFIALHRLDFLHDFSHGQLIGSGLFAASPAARNDSGIAGFLVFIRSSSDPTLQGPA